MNKIRVILILKLSLIISSIYSQDMHFSQFYMSPLTQNPAFTGINYDIEGNLNYKSQWQSVGAPYKTIAGSFDMKIPNEKSKTGFWGVGINLFSDKAGDSKMGIFEGNINGAYHIFLNRNNTLGLGFQGGFSQFGINYSELQWGNQYDGNNFNQSMPSGEPNRNNSLTFVDLSTGLAWSYNNNPNGNHESDDGDMKINAGLACYHFNEPVYSMPGLSNERLSKKYVIYGNAVIKSSNSNIAYLPGLIYYRQGKTQEILLGTMLRFILVDASKYTGFRKSATLSAGGYVRTSDAIIISTLLEFSSYAIGLSYDLNTSKLKTASQMRGGPEISLRYVKPIPVMIRTKARY